MSTDILQSRYEELDQVAQRFEQAATASEALRQRVNASVEPLSAGGWRGQAAVRFLAEMNTEVFPGLQRLAQALTTAAATTRQVKQIIQVAEQDAAGLFRDGQGQAAEASAGEDSGGLLSSIAGGVGDFFTGFFDEGKDMVMGLVNMVVHPVDAAKGLWHGITHPGELWDAIKKPYVDAWESGHPWQAIGRGTMFAVSALLGTKGADKLAEAAKVGRVAAVTADAAEASARTGSALNAARELATVGRGAEAEAGLARYLAQESTQTFKGVDRVILGPNATDPARGFLGYIKEAETHGGTVFNTGDDVWRTLQPRGTPKFGPGWTTNESFLQSALERGAPIELRGTSVSEIMSDPAALNTYRRAEVDFLRRNAYEWGYKQVGDTTWEKVGPWRATTSGRAVGSAVGATGEQVTAGAGR
ncbi:MAG TPA: WXG100 family type VII secretion target [Chloroflexota bacterium]|jgi:WXG100 family type VII secretion target